ncbi:DMT family transporter [Simkania negevensis]|uniref:DMT family transporter n=1 Tax=Simkania negevensis TaxID=83561 RepID=A0ABS3AT07_9BACT|nr:DMT family transporter [Simkania negevensis]
MMLVVVTDSLMAVLIKLTSSHTSTELAIFIRSAISLVLLFFWIGWKCNKKEKTAPLLKTQYPHLHAIRAIAGTGALLTYFYALKMLPLHIVTPLYYTIPIFIPLVGWVWLRNPISIKTWVGIVVGFLGILLIVNPGSEFFQIGSFLAIISSILTATAFIAIIKLNRTEPTHRTLFYHFLLSALATGIFAIKPENWISCPTTDLIILLFVGILGLLYHTFLTISIKCAPLKQTSPLLYLTIVFALCFDVALWGKTIAFNSIIGSSLIITGAILSTILNHQKERPLSQQAIQQTADPAILANNRQIFTTKQALNINAKIAEKVKTIQRATRIATADKA